MSLSPRSFKARHLLASFFLVVGTLGLSAAAAGPATADQSITSAGPLTNVFTSDYLNCAVNHSGDSAGEFYGPTACGTLVAFGSDLYGPQDIPAGADPIPYTPVSQSPSVTGSGTSGDPYEVATVVKAGDLDTGMLITQTDSYVVGEESYTTKVHVENLGPDTKDGVLYRAGDCYLQNDDRGFGQRNGDGSVACVEGVLTTDGYVPGDRIEQWSPITNGSHNIEAQFADMWNAVSSQTNLPDTCVCVARVDNGAALSWDFSLGAGQAKTFSSLITFSPLGTEPLLTSKTPDQDSVEAGGQDGYSITISNPNVQDATLDTITDDLPSGFAYVDGSTSGATTDDPTGSPGSLVWSGPFTVPAGESISLHFDVTASIDAGDYFNNAGGTAEGVSVVPTGNTAKITVNAPPPQADLSVSQMDSPDPVNGGNNVLYRVSVTNNGPDPADNVTLHDSPPGNFISGTPDNESPPCSEGEGGVYCDLGTVQNGETVTVDIVVQAPDTSETTSISNFADIFNSDTDDPNPGNNSSSEPTQVDPAGQGSGGNQGDTGYIPPDGGQLTTDPGTGPTPDDPTTITMKLGTGPGGTGSVTELDECATDLDLGPCVGQIGDFQPPDGYDKAVAVLVFDHSAVAGGLAGNRKHWHILYQKNGQTQELDQCGPNPVLNELIPCWKQIIRLQNRDLRVRVLINSDPKLAGRK